MPPKAINTIGEVIYYQYAKIISSSSGFGKTNYGMIMKKWKQLCSGEINWSTSTREWLREKDEPNKCIYCGEEKELTVEHMRRNVAVAKMRAITQLWSANFATPQRAVNGYTSGEVWKPKTNTIA